VVDVGPLVAYGEHLSDDLHIVSMVLQNYCLKV